MSLPIIKPRPLPIGLTVWWWVAVILSCPLYVRLLWEETILTWQRGPQVIGFSLVHQNLEVLMLDLLGNGLAIAWMLTVVVLFSFKRRRPSMRAIVYFSIFAVGTALESVPYEYWARLGGVELK